jgi:hypothetical protein
MKQRLLYSSQLRSRRILIQYHQAASSVVTPCSSDRVVWWDFEQNFSLDNAANPTVSVIMATSTSTGAAFLFPSLFALSSDFQLQQLSKLLEACVVRFANPCYPLIATLRATLFRYTECELKLEGTLHRVMPS